VLWRRGPLGASQEVLTAVRFVPLRGDLEDGPGEGEDLG
jgi:hypothetical protein